MKRRRPVHRAFVEQYVDDEGDVYFVASCLRTGKQCDAYVYDWFHGIDVCDEGSMMERAATNLGDRTIHDDGEHFCDAEHVL